MVIDVNNHHPLTSVIKEVFVDGIRQHKVFLIDFKDGYIEKYSTSAEGNFVLSYESSVNGNSRHFPRTERVKVKESLRVIFGL